MKKKQAKKKATDKALFHVKYSVFPLHPWVFVLGEKQNKKDLLKEETKNFFLQSATKHVRIDSSVCVVSSVMVSERVSSLCFTVSSSSSAVHLVLTRSTGWPCWHCLLPSFADPYFYCSASTARDELPKEATPLQPPKNDSYLEFFSAAFLNGPCEVQRKESGRAVLFGIPLETTTGGRRRRVVWARVAPPARVGRIALRSAWHPAPQSCNEKENEVVPGGQSSVADLS